MAFHILQLPDEIKVKIFKYLNGTDKIEILKVCKDFHRIGTDRDVLQRLNFTKNYKLTLSNLKFIGRKITAPLVIYLNLNGVHWIRSGPLADAIIKFRNLEILYLIDTQMFYRDLVKVTESLKKIKKLAYSLKSESCGDILKKEINVNLSHLYLTYNSRSVKSLMNLLLQIKKLEELWLIEPKWPDIIDKSCMIPWNFYSITSVTKVSRKIVCARLYSLKLEEYKYFSELKDLKEWESNFLCFPNDNFFRIDEAITCKSPHECSCEDKSCEKILETRMWMFSVNDPISLNKILNLEIRKQKCQADIFWRKSEKKANESENVSLFKKRRVGINSGKLEENSIFKQYTEVTNDMEDFELIDLDPAGVRDNLWTIEDLSLATNWKVLKKLTITSINFHSGKFLVEITKNCKMLECLKIQDELFQDNISSSLCEALQFAHNLKDLRYERKGAIPVDSFFISLTKCLKLERLFVQCRSASKITKKPLETVIARCENLVFLFIYITELQESVCKSIKQSINELGVKPQQIINIRGQSYTMNNMCYEDIPSCHVEEIVNQESNPVYEYCSTFFK